MAPRKPTPTERLDEIEPRLERIESSLGLRASPIKVFRTACWLYVKENKTWMLPVIAILVSVVGWVASNQYRSHLDNLKQEFDRSVDDRVSATLNTKGGVNEQLAKISSSTEQIAASLNTLAPFIHDVITRQFDSAAKLSPQALGERLPGVRDLLVVAKSQGVEVDPQITDTLSKKLLQVQTNAPGYWPAAGELLSYHSAQMSPPIVVSRALPVCPGGADLDNSPNARIEDLDDGGKSYPLVRLGNQDCAITLDSQRISRWDCTRCLVTYSGSPVSLRDVHFKNCIFIFVFPPDPNPSGQKLTKTLLASNISDATIPAAPS